MRFSHLKKTEGKSKKKKIVSSTANPPRWKVGVKVMFTMEQNQTVSMELDLLILSTHLNTLDPKHTLNITHRKIVSKNKAD